ncbi:MAG TPA: S9 family peptidase [Burkholderiaceae bacterium]
MPDKIAAAFGSWKSPISSDLIVADSVRLGQPRIAGQDIWWSEGRPSQEGRCFLVRADRDGNCTDMTGADFNVRTRANEYGGGEYLVAGDMVYFSNNEDQRLYRCLPGQQPQALTRQESMRYADAILDAGRQRLVAVREDHSQGGHEPVNTLVAIDLADGEETVLHTGHDFYSSPRLAPSGKHLAWICWDHPNMPWDGTELWQAEIGTDGSLLQAVRVAGGADESIFQPEYSKSGVLHFVSDRSGWWNLYREGAGTIEPLCPMEAEFGEAQWIFGMSAYAFDGEDRLICTYVQRGRSHLAILDEKNGKLQPIAVPFEAISDLQAGDGFVAFCGGSPRSPKSIVRLDLASGAHRVLRSANNLRIAEENLSLPEALEFPTEHGLTAHAFFYRPANAQFTGPAGTLPPLLVLTHGGPTAMTTATLNLSIQYWTSRGFAVVDVNYGGSSGYGRAYRRRLNGGWGVVDVDDAANAARHLAQLGEVDSRRSAIRGSSAGGYTTLSALTFRDLFQAGASYYGIGDLETLVADTHKFEARYLDKLIGPYPEAKQRYVERSPIHFTDRLSSPLILFQGMKDKVVPPNQAEAMFDAVKVKGLPVACVHFEQEGHGFRQAANIKRALDAELYFYSKVFGFELAERIEPVKIENLPS